MAVLEVVVPLRLARIKLWEASPSLVAVLEFVVPLRLAPIKPVSCSTGPGWPNRPTSPPS